MPVALSPKQQRFVDEYRVDQNATQAAVRAGYSKATAKQQGSRLLTNVDICAAVQKGQQRQADRLDITIERITNMLLEDRELAEKCEQAGAAVSATMGIAKLHGLVIDKSERTDRRYVVRIPSPSENAQEWQQQHAPQTPRPMTH